MIYFNIQNKDVLFKWMHFDKGTELKLKSLNTWFVLAAFVQE